MASRSRRTIPRHCPRLSSAFFAARPGLTDKNWGVSIYGAVQHADTFWWLTHAYDLGATRFFFYDSYQLACVPYGEYLALARHLRRMREATRSAILRVCGVPPKSPFCCRRATISATFSWAREFCGALGN